MRSVAVQQPFTIRTVAILSVAVVVSHPLPNARPHLLFREATVPAMQAGSREVPLLVYCYPSSDGRIYSFQSQVLKILELCQTSC